MKQCLERLYNGIVKENPTFVLMLGMCPTLAVTVSAINGFGMGISTMAVLALSNLLISLLRKIIPDKVRIPAYIVIVAAFVTIVELLMHAFVPGLYKSLGIYISLIVVNCIILGRAEAYASINKPLPSLFDGIGMGLGFTGALTIIGFVRELIGSGKVFGFTFEDMFGIGIIDTIVSISTKVFPLDSTTPWLAKTGEFFAEELGSLSPIGIFVLAPGAFFVLATLTAIQNKVKMELQQKGKDASKIQSGCNSDCLNCHDSGCTHRLINTEVKEESKVVPKKVVIDDLEIEDMDTLEEAEVKEETAEIVKINKEDVDGVKKERTVKKVTKVEATSTENESKIEDVTSTDKPKKTRAKKTADESKTVANNDTKKESSVQNEEKPKRTRSKKTVDNAAVEKENTNSDITKEMKEPKEPKVPKEPKAPKEPKEPKVPKEPKAPKEPKKSKESKEEQKEDKTPMEDKPKRGRKKKTVEEGTDNE